MEAKLTLSFDSLELVCHAAGVVEHQDDVDGLLHELRLRGVDDASIVDVHLSAARRRVHELIHSGHLTRRRGRGACRSAQARSGHEEIAAATSARPQSRRRAAGIRRATRDAGEGQHRGHGEG
jgi:hypothetical protein